MKPRMNFYQAAPDTMKALMALETHIPTILRGIRALGQFLSTNPIARRLVSAIVKGRWRVQLHRQTVIFGEVIGHIA